MRVISGKWKKQRLDLPPKEYARPTKDRVKESFFNILENKLLNGYEHKISWSQVLFVDGFSGSGSIGIEALSRGAGHVIFVENNIHVVSALRQNLSSLKPTIDQNNITLIKEFNDLPQVNEIKQVRNFDFVCIYLDPPYGQGLEKNALFFMQSKNYFDTKGVLILEESIEYQDNGALFNVSLKDQRFFGQTKLLLFSF